MHRDLEKMIQERDEMCQNIAYLKNNVYTYLSGLKNQSRDKESLRSRQQAKSWTGLN